MIWRGSNIAGEKALRFFLIATLVIAFSSFTARVSAASVTSASDTLSTIKQSVLADHTIQMITPTGVAAGETITVVFPTGFALGSFSVNNEDLAESASTSCASFSDKTLAGSPSGATWGVAQASQTITFTSGTDTITAGHCIQIEIGANATSGAAGASIITNQSAAQNASDAKILLTAGSADTGTVAVEIVADNTLAVTGTVDPQITCVISSTDGDSDANPNTTSFGTFTLGTVTTANDIPTWTISTNATNGYNLSVRSAGNTTNAGLYSAAAGYVIKSADSAEASTADLSVSATIGYGLQGTKTNGDAGSATTTVQSPYTSTSTTVGRLQLTAQPLASATGPVSNATVVSTLKAKVTAFVPAGSYADTLTYVCTGIY